MRLIQVTPSLNYGDAVSNDLFALHELFVKNGYQAEIYASILGDKVDRNLVKTMDQWVEPKGDDVIIYHLSIGWEYIGHITGARCRKVCIYHNVTPPHFFEQYNFQTYVHCLDGRDEVKRLKDAFDYCICDSEYNKQELLDFGYSCQIDVVPILIPFEDYQKTPDAGVIEKYKGKKGKNILFTGRVAPNKKHEDLIHAFSLYRKQYDEDARLFIVGRHMDNPTYYAHLVNYIEENHFENIYFSDHVSFAEILAYYKIADLFLCMSEHEGFCVPLVEAMMFDIPVLAYDEGAIRYTMGDSGIVFEEKNFPEVASLMHLVLEDEELKKEIIARQRKRVEDFHPEIVGKEMLHAIEKFLAKEVKR